MQPEVLLRISAVAERIGVKASTLRTWERRYGLRPTGHSAGAHRQYTGQDVTRLIIMRQLTVQGIPPAEAAQMALTDDRCCAEIVEPPPASRLVAVVDTPGLHPSDSYTEPLGPLDGDLRCAPPRVRKALRLAQRLDQERLFCYLTEEIEQLGFIPTWETLIVPALHVIGRQWAVTGRNIETEHMLSTTVKAAIDRYSARYTARAGLVLLTTAEDEQHDLPLAALNAALSERGARAVSLGACTPFGSLISACAQLQPDVVLVLALMPAPATLVSQMAGLANEIPTILAGPGWIGATDEHNVVTTATFDETVNALVSEVPL